MPETFNAQLLLQLAVEWMGVIAVAIIFTASPRFKRQPVTFKYPRRELYVSLSLWGLVWVVMWLIFSRLTAEMGIVYNRCALVVNRLRRVQLPECSQHIADAVGADYLVALPDDEQIASISEHGRPLHTLSDDHAVVQKIDLFLSDAGY